MMISNNHKKRKYIQMNIPIIDSLENYFASLFINFACNTTLSASL